MKYHNLLLVIILSSAFAANAQLCQKLVWQDEFDYEGKPDANKWGYDTGGGGWGNNEAQFYTNRLENAFVKDGHLTIKAIKENYEGKEYTSARLVTKNKGDWKYGRFEIKARLPGGRGTWPAIWMLPTDWEYGGWPSSGEIDIMEHVGYDMNVVHGTVHTNAYNHLKGTQKGSNRTLGDVVNDFHVYAIEWTENQIDFFIDGDKYFTFFKNSDSYKEWPFDKRFHLILNIAVGGNWGGVEGIDENVFPVEMVVDYVRVYQSFKALEVSGPTVVNKSQKGLEFTCTQIPEVEYEWTIPDGATIISGQGTSKILIDWIDEAGSVSVRTVTNDGCNGLKGERKVDISFAPDTDKFLIDDFDGNSFGAFEDNNLIQTSMINGLLELESAREGEVLIYTFNELLNISKISLLKMVYEGDGHTGPLAIVHLIDADGNMTESLTTEIAPKGQQNTLYAATDFLPANEIDIQKVKAIAIEVINPSKKISLLEMAFFSNQSPPIAPQNPRLIQYGETYLLWWQDSPSAAAYDILFGPEADGEFYVQYSNLQGNENPKEVSFTSVKKYFRVVAKNDAGLSEPSKPITEQSVGIDLGPAEKPFLVFNSAIVFSEPAVRVIVINLEGKTLIDQAEVHEVSLEGLSGILIVKCIYQNRILIEKIKVN